MSIRLNSVKWVALLSVVGALLSPVVAAQPLLAPPPERSPGQSQLPEDAPDLAGEFAHPTDRNDTICTVVAASHSHS